VSIEKDKKLLIGSGAVFVLIGIFFIIFGGGNFGWVCLLLGAALIGISFTIKPKSDG
jgi:hypothetical protein